MNHLLPRWYNAQYTLPLGANSPDGAEAPLNPNKQIHCAAAEPELERKWFLELELNRLARRESELELKRILELELELKRFPWSELELK